MSFVISKTQAYFWPVTVKLPSDGGKFSEEKFDAKFKRLSQSRLSSLWDEIEAGTTTDQALCREVMIDWKGMTDDDGKELPFSQINFDRLLDVQLVAAAIVKAFVESVTGSKVKN